MLKDNKIHFSLIYSATLNNPQKKYLRQCNPYATIKYLNRSAACIRNNESWGGFNISGEYTVMKEPYEMISKYKPLIIYEMVINYSEDIMKLDVMKNEDFFKILNGYLVRKCLIQLQFNPYITYSLIFHHTNGAHQHIHAIFFEYKRTKIRNAVSKYALVQVHKNIVKRFIKIFEKTKSKYFDQLKTNFQLFKVRKKVIAEIEIKSKMVNPDIYKLKNRLIIEKKINPTRYFVMTKEAGIKKDKCYNNKDFNKKIEFDKPIDNTIKSDLIKIGR